MRKQLRASATGRCDERSFAWPGRALRGDQRRASAAPRWRGVFDQSSERARRGPRCVVPPPHEGLRGIGNGGKQADRPDSVRRFPDVAIIPLGDALLRRSSRQPACSRGRLVHRPGRARHDAHMPIRRCFGWGFACHRCRHRRGELLPRLFNLAVRTSPRGPCVLGGVFSVPLSVALSLAACCAWPLASTLPCEVRTFLQRRAAGQARDPAPAIAWPASRPRFYAQRASPRRAQRVARPERGRNTATSS